MHGGSAVGVVTFYFFFSRNGARFSRSVLITYLCLFHSVKSTAYQSAIQTAMLSQL